MSVHPCAILADKNGYAWSFAQRVHANLVGRNGGFDLVEIEYQRFRDGEEKPRILENVRKKNCYFIHDSSLDPPLWRTRIKDVNYAIKFSSAQSVIDVIPYLKYARQDCKDESRVPITAKVVAKEISVDATSALILDLHNRAIQGFFDIPTDTLFDYFYKYLNSTLRIQVGLKLAFYRLSELDPKKIIFFSQPLLTVGIFLMKK